MIQEKIRNLISQMTLEEKAGMCSGLDFWHLKGIERLGIPSVMVTDGPNGVRKQSEKADHLGINDSEQSICFPAGCAVASSFDRNLVRKLGETVGKECQAMGVSTILGPSMNIKRSPLCGRNFEYYSEDPYVSSELGTAMVEGVQSQNIGTSTKHFIANNQEKRRHTNSSDVDERTLREIYLASFEQTIKKAKPWTVMSSYNRINGTYVGESREYLTKILREEWGFDGLVLSDWGGVNDRVEALQAGLDLEMPSSNGMNDARIVKAVQEGSLSESVVDCACERILNMIFKYVENKEEAAVFHYGMDHKIAAEIEEECMVLMKNEEHILPLKKEQKIVFIGKYAEEPRYQGGGSAHITSWKVESALEAVSGIGKITFAKGFDDVSEALDDKLVEEALEAAAKADVVVVFAGLPDKFESEGYDRKHLNLPKCQNELIERILKVQKQVVVVLHNGSPVLMPWRDKVKGILEAYLGGEAVGSAVVRVLFGMKNPSGRLAETFPMRLEDTPCYLTYGKGRDHANYQEGVFVGYRHYSSIGREVLFPFGYGLSYTEFEYCNLHLDKGEMQDTDTLTVQVDVKNTGMLTGKEVIQLYVTPPEGDTVRPVRELRGFEKVELEPGETKRVTFTVDMRAFAYWNTEIHDWFVESGSYGIMIGKNVQDILLEEVVLVQGTKTIPKVYSMNTCLGELFRDEKAQSVMGAFMAGMGQNTEAQEMQKQQEEDTSGAVNQEMMAAMLEEMPIRQLLSFVPGVEREMLEQLLAALNAQ